MKTIKETQLELKAWGRCLARERLINSGDWRRTDSIESLRERAGLIDAKSAYELSLKHSRTLYLAKIEAITTAVDQIKNPAIRVALVDFYVKKGARNRSLLPRHVQIWLKDGEIQIMKISGLKLVRFFN